MIVETVFNTIETALQAEYGTIYVINDYSRKGEKFPTVFIELEDNADDNETMDEDRNYEIKIMKIEIFTKTTATITRKKLGWEIAKIINDEMFDMGFRTVYQRPVPNFDEKEVFRILSRYQARVHETESDYITFRR